MNTKRAADDAANAIANAAEKATATIAAAAAEATKVLAAAAAAAAAAAESNRTNNAADHDTLTTLVASVANLDAKLTEKFIDLKTDIKGLSDGTGTQINDHEIRLNALETSKTKQNTMMAIGIGILTLLTSLLVYHLLGK